MTLESALGPAQAPLASVDVDKGDSRTLASATELEPGRASGWPSVLSVLSVWSALTQGRSLRPGGVREASCRVQSTGTDRTVTLPQTRGLCGEASVRLGGRRPGHES